MDRAGRPLRGPLLALALTCAALTGCEVADDARAAEIADVLTRADEPLLRTRPGLVARKYRAMARSPYAFLRGSFPLFLHDASEDADLAQSQFDARSFPLSVGDAHPENVGVLLSADGTLGVEWNDFDAADRWPWIWEVRRLATAMAVAAAASNADDPVARAAARRGRREIARAVAEGYATEILGEGPRRRVERDSGSAHFADLLERGARDQEARAELDELTAVEGGSRRLLRGGLDEADPESQLVDVDVLVRTALPDALEAWRTSLLDPVDAAFVAVKDVARELGAGIASRPRARFLALVEGPTGSAHDDVILEVKEIADSGSRGFVPPGVVTGGSPAERVVACARLAWARPDAEPMWGHARLLGLPVQIRAEREAHKSLRIARLVEDLGTPEALVDLGRHVGGLLGRVHRASDDHWPGTAIAIATALRGDPAGFAEEQAVVAVAWADRVEADHATFVRLLEAQGDLLGFHVDGADAPDAEERALYGGDAW